MVRETGAELGFWYLLKTWVFHYAELLFRVGTRKWDWCKFNELNRKQVFLETSVFLGKRIGVIGGKTGNK